MTIKEYDTNELTKLCTRAFMVWRNLHCLYIQT